MTRTRVLVTSQDRIGPRMAGPAIRSVEFARALARDADVTLLTSEPVDATGAPCDVRRYTSESELRSAVRRSDVVIAFGSLLDRYPSVGRSDACFVADLYDPAILEALVQHEGDPLARQEQFHRGALRALTAQLRRADLVLCASERQRHFVLGMLTTAGRLNPETYRHDPALRSFVRIVPFGLPPAPAPAVRPGPLRERLHLAEHDVVAIWGGGIHEWLDPMTLLDAVANLDDDIKVVFMGTTHPTASVGAMPVGERVVERAKELHLTGRRVFFLEGWVPYEERIHYLLDADIGVSLHRDHIESELSFRTRLLDYLWAGLPIVCSTGDSFSAFVRERHLGEAVPIGDTAAVRRALQRLRDPAERAQHVGPLATAAAEFRWDTVVAPVVEFCRSPQRALDSSPGYRRLRLKVEISERVHAVAQRVIRGRDAGPGAGDAP